MVEHAAVTGGHWPHLNSPVTLSEAAHSEAESKGGREDVTHNAAFPSNRD
jgi:hypothetical protein